MRPDPVPGDPGRAGAGGASWLPAALNQGWSYRERVGAGSAGIEVSAFLAARHRHSGRATWRERLQAGEIERNGRVLRQDEPLVVGDRLIWHRPPWREPAVPGIWQVVFDDGDLLVIDKPAGLPVLPAGGFLEHTVLRLLERHHAGAAAGVPRPVHRLGRFTSGLLVCARRAATRAWLSARLRDSTATELQEPEPQEPAGQERAGQGEEPCRKLYRALVIPAALPLAVGGSLPIRVPIGLRAHPVLGRIWCAADGSDPSDRSARSSLTLLEREVAADLVLVAIASGRPHQIRIHCAAVGAPLLGDPLYAPGGKARAEALPGDGGYRLQAWRLELHRPDGEPLSLEAPTPLQSSSATAAP